MLQNVNRVLAALTAADVAAVSPHLKEVPLTARQVLHEAQSELAFVYFPTDGLISLIVVTEDGETLETASIGIDGAVGLHAVFGVRRAAARAIVQVAGVAQRIGIGALRRVMQDRPAISDALVRAEQLLAVQTQQLAACNALHRVERRLARWLLQAHDRSGKTVVPIIQESIAQSLGVRRTTVNLVVGGLQQTGAIRYRRGRVEIVDRERLMTECCSCYETIRSHIADIESGRDTEGVPAPIPNQSSR